MDDTTKNELIQMLEYVEGRLDEAENAVWTDRPEGCHGEIEQPLDKITADLWNV